MKKRNVDDAMVARYIQAADKAIRAAGSEPTFMPSAIRTALEAAINPPCSHTWHLTVPVYMAGNYQVHRYRCGVCFETKETRIPVTTTDVVSQSVQPEHEIPVTIEMDQAAWSVAAGLSFDGSAFSYRTIARLYRAMRALELKRPLVCAKCGSNHVEHERRGYSRRRAQNDVKEVHTGRN